MLDANLWNSAARNNSFKGHKKTSQRWQNIRQSESHSMNKTLSSRQLRVYFLGFFFATVTTAQTPEKLLFDGKSWWDHVKVVADDNMEGRETGSLGLRKAEAYAVEQLKHAGLEPAGTNGFYQNVKFVQRTIDEKNSFAFLTSECEPTPVSLGTDAYFTTRIEGSDQELNTQLVFAGNGLQVPENNLDELAGLDLIGKIVVYLAGSPSTLPRSLAAHYGGICAT